MNKKFSSNTRKKSQRALAVFVVALVLLSQLFISVNAMAAEEDYAQPLVSTVPSPDSQDITSPEPTESLEPTESIEPSESAVPTENVQPSESPEPTESVMPTESAQPTESIQQTEGMQMTESALSTLGEMTPLGVGTPDVQVNNETALNTALSNATGSASSPYVIEVMSSFYINGAKTIGTGKYIKLVSSDGSTFTLTRGTTAYNMFDVQGSLTLENIIIDGGSVNTIKNTVRVSSGATFDMEPGSVLQNAICTTGSGSAVYNQGTFNLNGGVIKNNNVRLQNSVIGGAVYNSGPFTMTAGIISGNTVSSATGDTNVQGGVIYNTSGATFTMSGGVIGGDVADANTTECSNWGGINGGVVYNAGTFTMNGNALIKGNKLYRTSSWPYASVYGGVVYNDGTFTMSDSAQISGNEGDIDLSLTYGLGVYSYGASARFTMQDNAKIKDNTATNLEGNSSTKGGGVYNYHGSQFTMQGNAEISGNQLSSTTSSSDGAGVHNEGAGSVFTMKGSAKISNNTVSSDGSCYGGGVYNLNSAAFDFQSGTISGNTVTSLDNASIGGGVYSYNSTTFTMSGGTITGNSTNSSLAGTYSRGGGVFTSNATFTLSGGTISSNSANNTSGYAEGGGVFNWNIFNMTGGTITGNTAKNGGGVCNYTTFNMSGSADISSNTASVEGGGVENTTGTFTLTGGTIAGNTAPKGRGVLNAATFNMSGGAAVDTNNDVYLNSGKVINVTAALSGTSPFAVIKPPAYSAGSNVVTLASGLSADTYSAKFLVAPNGTTPWGLKANGQNLQLAPGEIYLNGATGADTNDGSTKATAVATLEKAKSLLGSIGTIYICGTVTIPSGNDSAYTWTLADGQMIKRYDDPVSSANDFTGIMVQVDGNLTLQNITIDGGWDEASGTGVEAVYPIILENSTGVLTINAGAALQNNNIVIPSPDPTDRFAGSGVQGTGSVTMTGGKICGNIIQISSGTNRVEGAGIGMGLGTLTMTGGVVSGNTLDTGTGYGAGIYVQDTVFAMSGGTVSGNDTCTYGGGIFIDSGSTFTMSGGTIGGSALSDANTAEMGGGLFILGTTDMSGGNITGNNTTATISSQGGGVANQGSFTMSGSASITGNTSPYGGGLSNQADFYISESASIDGNTAQNSGGGVYCATIGDFEINGGSICNNSAATGGGITVSNGALNMTAGSINGNDATDSGGGIYNESPYILRISGGTISGNSAVVGGGGIYGNSSGRLSLSGGTISANTASAGGGIVNNYILNMSGGTITGNTASTGAGVYNYAGAFNLSGGALVAQNNPVYLNTYTYITVKGALGSSPAAWVIPAAYPDEGDSVKVASANYTGATGATILSALAAANSGYGLRASGNDVYLVKKLDATITLGDASADYTGSTISFPGAVTKPSDIALSDLVFLYKLKTADDSAYSKAAPISAGVYSVKATLSGNAKYNDTVSNAATFTIVMPAAQTPVFTKNLLGEFTYYSRTFACNLKVAASVSDKGVLSYQWYKNNANSTVGGTPIAGATGDSYTVQSGSKGTVYYYVVATNTLYNDASHSASAVSGTAKITVKLSEGTEPTSTPSPAATQSPAPSATQSPSPASNGSGTEPGTTQTPSQASGEQDNVQVSVIPGTTQTPSATVSDTEGLKDSVLTQEDKAALQSGENITIVLKVERVDEPVNQGDNEKVESSMGESTLGMYLNVELLKQIGKSQQPITQIDKPMRIVLAVPPELLKEGRAYSVIRVHGDETTVLPDLDNDPATITIETDRFSTYALVYNDKPAMTIWWILIICVLIAALIIIVICLTKRKKRKYSV